MTQIQKLKAYQVLLIRPSKTGGITLACLKVHWRSGEGNSNETNFYFGYGRSKTGTTWLHRMLAQEDNVNLGIMKEYHIWDYVYADLKYFGTPVKKADNAYDAMRRTMQASSETYTKYFQGLLNSDINVTGDITPSYAIINELGLEKISSIIKGAGFEMNVIFLMRDPVERIWSAVRDDK